MSMYYNITLADFLLLFSSKDGGVDYFSVVNTDNESFPKEYRYKHENPASLFRKLYELDNSKPRLLDRYIEFISLYPADADITNRGKSELFQMEPDGIGFYTLKNQLVHNNIYTKAYMPHAAAIHIVLSKESKGDKDNES